MEINQQGPAAAAGASLLAPVHVASAVLAPASCRAVSLKGCNSVKSREEVPGGLEELWAAGE